MTHGPVNGPDGPTTAFLDSVIATAMKWVDGDDTVSGAVIKEQERDGAYIASTGAVLLEDYR